MEILGIIKVFSQLVRILHLCIFMVRVPDPVISIVYHLRVEFKQLHLVPTPINPPSGVNPGSFRCQ